MAELREIMAELGFRKVEEMVGQVEYLKVRENVTHWKHKNLDLSPDLVSRTCFRRHRTLQTGRTGPCALQKCWTGNC